MKFPTPGPVEVYCNIHEAMSASVLVLPNRAFAFVDEAGHFVLHDVPVGKHTLHAWGREIDPVSMQVEVTGGVAPPAVVELTAHPRAFRPGHLDKFGRPYRSRGGYGP